MSLTKELFRFRVVRGVQASPAGNVLDLTAAAAAAGKVNLASVSPSSRRIDPRTWNNWLASFSSTLASRGDAVAPADAVALLPSNWETQVQGAQWQSTSASLVGSLVGAMKAITGTPTNDQVTTVEGLTRLLRVQYLVDTLAQDANLPANEQTLQTSGDVQSLLGSTPVVLPLGLFPKSPVKLVRQPGVTDLYVVNDEWNRYEAGELSQVINVLPGETFETRLRHFDKTETATSTTTENTTTQQTETDQTQSSSLAESSTKDASLNVGVQGQVQVSAQYGPAHIQTSLGAQLQSAQSTSDSRAMTTSFETVQRAVKTVSQTVIEVQSSLTVVGDVTTEDHKLQNSGNQVTVGLYRWLSEIHRVQLERYPNRYVLEFEIPEPGAWLRWALQNQPATQFDNPDPGPFRLPGASEDLTPTDITATTYTQLAGLWQVAGLTPPPPATLTLSVALSGPPDSPGANLVQVATDTSATVPTGYQATSWTAGVSAIRDNGDAARGTAILLSVGGAQQQQSTVGAPSGQQVWVINQTLSGQVGDINTGPIPITLYATSVYGYAVGVNIECTLMAEAMQTWQENTFDQVAAAYQSLLSAYQQERDAANQQPGSSTTLAGPPDLNQARSTAELRRLVIEQLLGTQFNGEPAIDTNESSTPADEPSVDLTEALAVAPTVQFFEQAFEWENLVYVCYPYYWGRRSQWITNATSASADPVFDQFLDAGSARVVVPARPGFENLVAYYVYTGQIWGGSQPPAPNDPDYLSVAQEIQAIEQGASDGTPVGSSWEISLPTTLLWAGDDPTTLPTNPNPTIPAPTT